MESPLPESHTTAPDDLTPLGPAPESNPDCVPLVSHPTQVQRNCCLTLCNFSIPEELEFQYRRVNELLLSILNPTRQDESIQRIAVHLCNALVCQVDNDHKEAVGKMGFVVVRALELPLLQSPPCPMTDLG